MMKTKNTFQRYQDQYAKADSAIQNLLAAIASTKAGKDRDGIRDYAYTSGYFQSMLTSMIADASPQARKRMLKHVADHAESIRTSAAREAT